MLAQRSTESIFPEATRKPVENINPRMLNTPLPFRATNFQERDNLPGLCTHINKLTLNKENIKNMLVWKKKKGKLN